MRRWIQITATVGGRVVSAVAGIRIGTLLGDRSTGREIERPIPDEARDKDPADVRELEKLP